MKPAALVRRALGGSRRSAYAAVARRRYRLVEAGACPCGSREATVVERGRTLGWDVAILGCGACGLGRLSPRLADADLERYYARDYRRLAVGTRRVTDEQFERGRRRGRGILEFLAAAGCLPPPGSTVVEIGSGPGGILAELRDRGYDVVGTEADPRCAAYARGRRLRIAGAGVPAVADVPSPVGLVVMSHVLEHMPDPVDVLRSVAGLAGESTLVYVEVPGLRSGRPRATEPQLPHLYYFDAASLTGVARAAGLEPVVADEHVRAVFRAAQ